MYELYVCLITWKNEIIHKVKTINLNEINTIYSNTYTIKVRNIIVLVSSSIFILK